LKSVQSLKLPELMEAEVVSGPPDLKLKLKGNDKLIVPKELIVVAERLCRVKRKATLANSGKTSVSPAQSFTGKTDDVPGHLHDVTLSVALSDRDFKAENSEIHYLNDDLEDDVLKAGDKVLVVSYEGGQKYFVMDRIVTY
jgi:hypothetical protein